LSTAEDPSNLGGDALAFAGCRHESNSESNKEHK
jgi:hypothetical protein